MAAAFVQFLNSGINRPNTLSKMLAAAEAIAGQRDHLCVDFYEVDGVIFFGKTCLSLGLA